MIEAWHVREALRSRFGSALVDQPGRPYILCFFGSDVSVPVYGRLIQDASRRIWEEGAVQHETL